MATFNDVLNDKDLRHKLRQALLKKHNLPIISLSLNVPGVNKKPYLAKELMNWAVTELQKSNSISETYFYHHHTSYFAILVADSNQKQLKKICIALEDKYNFCRLLDVDVYHADNEPYSRTELGHNARKCLLCNNQATLCMRERKHSMQDIISAVDHLFKHFAAHMTRYIVPSAELIASYATEAALYEAVSFPSPGLVSMVSNGAHGDMNIFTFLSSTAALSHTFARCAMAGINLAKTEPSALSFLLPTLRIIGTEGEERMFSATNNINTQKGLLFSLGICVAVSAYLAAQKHPLSACLISETTKAVCQNLCLQELFALSPNDPDRKKTYTAGEKIFISSGLTGIRGEMEEGMPNVIKHALPALQQAKKQQLPHQLVLAHALITLIAHVNDTTVINRHSYELLSQWLQPSALRILEAGSVFNTTGLELLHKFDRDCLSRRISPGGSADLLAVTWFIDKILSSQSHSTK